MSPLSPWGDFQSRRLFVAAKMSEISEAPEIGATKFKSTNERPAISARRKFETNQTKTRNFDFRAQKKAMIEVMLNHFEISFLSKSVLVRPILNKLTVIPKNDTC